jgi:hypothetical protein
VLLFSQAAEVGLLKCNGKTGNQEEYDLKVYNLKVYDRQETFLEPVSSGQEELSRKGKDVWDRSL